MRAAIVLNMKLNYKTLSRLSCGSRFVISVPQSYYSIEKNTQRDCFTAFAMTLPSQRILSLRGAQRRGNLPVGIEQENQSHVICQHS